MSNNIRIMNNRPSNGMECQDDGMNNQHLGLVITAGIRHGQQKLGVEKGPERLLKLYSFPENMLVVNAFTENATINGISTKPDDIAISSNPHVPILNVQSVGQANQRLHEEIYEKSLQMTETKGSLPKILTLGGDHSLSIGSISAISNLCIAAIKTGNIELFFSDPALVVFWVDAHTDINTPSVTESGNLHGCPVSLLLGLDKEGWRELKHFDWAYEKLAQIGKDRKQFIKPSKLVYIGVRDIDEEEQKILDQHSIITHDMNKIRTNHRSMGQIISESLQIVDPAGNSPIHISFDIDGIDPAYAPSTGTPVVDGILPEEGVELIKLLKTTNRLISMDLVEVNPSIGDCEDIVRTLGTATLLIDTFIN